MKHKKGDTIYLKSSNETVQVTGVERAGTREMYTLLVIAGRNQGETLRLTAQEIELNRR